MRPWDNLSLLFLNKRHKTYRGYEGKASYLSPITSLKASDYFPLGVFGVLIAIVGQFFT
jgi:hypothetical protein